MNNQAPKYEKVCVENEDGVVKESKYEKVCVENEDGVVEEGITLDYDKEAET